ncbi:MAG: carboxymuconolactone decarboxylase family protein [Candidatus Bipolaricaulis sp.]|nr:carboxymuconolactone decarboxylase family protein [Candidatus Bipolaricaulis sp.]
MDKLREIERKRKEAFSWFMAHKSRGYRAVSEMDEPIMSDGALTRKHKELIAVGISVTIDCESCMQWHIEKAAEHGATLEEILEAVDVAIMMGNGAATVRARFAMDVMKDVFGDRT